MDQSLGPFIFLYTFLSLDINIGDCGPSFCYNKNDLTCGPRSPAWGTTCQSGKNQTPINLPATPSKVWSSSTASKATISFNEAYKQGVDVTFMTNNGHTVVFSVTEDQTSTMTLQTSLFPDPYTFGQAHCHWDSEHLMASKRYPLECHFVHYNSKYDSIQKAIDSGETGSLLIFGILYENSAPKNQKSPMATFIKNLHRVQKANETVTVGHMNFYKMLLFNPNQPFVPRNQRRSQINLDVHSYTGSLTTPMCSEGMHWLVLRNRRSLTKAQIKSFMTVKDQSNQKMRGNFRQIQPLNGRVITPVRFQMKQD